MLNVAVENGAHAHTYCHPTVVIAKMFSSSVVDLVSLHL